MENPLLYAGESPLLQDISFKAKSGQTVID